MSAVAIELGFARRHTTSRQHHQQQQQEQPPLLRSLDLLKVPYAVFSDTGWHIVSGAAVALLGDPAKASDGWAWARIARALEAPAAKRRLPDALWVDQGCRAEFSAGDLCGGEGTIVLLLPCPNRAAEELSGCGLTAREQEVARLVAAGRSTKEVGGALGISYHTARHHTERVFAKLGVRTRVEVALMLSRGREIG
jgi:DNA-binding CsgD family transcriptional regulator